MLSLNLHVGGCWPIVVSDNLSFNPWLASVVQLFLGLWLNPSFALRPSSCSDLMGRAHLTWPSLGNNSLAWLFHKNHYITNTSWKHNNISLKSSLLFVTTHGCTDSPWDLALMILGCFWFYNPAGRSQLFGGI